LEIGEKPGIFRLTYRPHSSSANCARELFKPSKDSASLWLCNEKNWGGGSCYFVSDIISEVSYWPFWLLVPDLGPITAPNAFNVGEIIPQGANLCFVGAIVRFMRFEGRFL